MSLSNNHEWFLLHWISTSDGNHHSRKQTAGTINNEVQHHHRRRASRCECLIFNYLQWYLHRSQQLQARNAKYGKWTNKINNHFHQDRNRNLNEHPLNTANNRGLHFPHHPPTFCCVIYLKRRENNRCCPRSRLMLICASFPGSFFVIPVEWT